MSPLELQIQTENLPGSLVGVSIEVPSPEVDRAYERVLSRLQQRARIEGFRPGKAPREMVLARLGEAAVREEAIDLLIPEVVGQALREKSISAIDTPRVDIAEFERGRPARFTARVTVLPEVKLPDLDSIRVPRIETEVGEGEVERRLSELQSRLAELHVVEREVRLGDVLVVDLDAEVDGQELEAERRRAMEVEVQEGVLIPELLAVLPGLTLGESARAEVQMPDDHSNPDLAGRLAVLVMTVRGVKERHIPELTDELAAQISGGEQSSVDALRQAVADDLRQQAARSDLLATEREVLKALVEASEVEVPEALVEREVEGRMHELEHQLAQQGLKLERYLEYAGKTATELAAEMRPESLERVRVDLVLGAASDALQVSVEEGEVDQQIEAEAAGDPTANAAELRANPIARDHFRHRLTRLRTLEELVQRLAVAAPEPPAKKAPSAPRRRKAKAGDAE